MSKKSVLVAAMALCGVVVANAADRPSESTTNFVYSTAAFSSKTTASAIIGTGAKGNAIIGTGAKGNAIIDTGVKGNAIIGTGR